MTTEVEWRRRWKPHIGAKPWRQFTIDQEIYLVKFYGGSAHYELLVSDFTHVWHEKLDEAGIGKRSKKLNPNVEAPLSKLLEVIGDRVEVQKKKAEYSVTRKETEDEEPRIIFTVNTELAGLPFVWKFHGTPASRDVSAQHLNIPLLGMVGELLRREQELGRLLKNKDKEIDDYKAQGIRVSRKHLETPAFDETAFTNSMTTSKGFENEVRCLGQSAFTEEGQALYADIMCKRSWLTRGPREVLDGESLLDEESIETPGAAGGTSWGNRIPTSLIPSAAPSPNVSPRKSPAVSPVKSPAKSPAKSSSAESTPVKDSELLRRQALERRLQEEEGKKDQQKAKKKKKIKF